ncbi:toxin-antitoxin system YwqK family antitoxin [Maribacter halichondriae]|uniref:toxin-antitoxin system YwqK family antitoxin n=1 Tax=Maribacter halichondriae TaxID=2980554 RepID=UPI002358C1E8|nr:nicotinic acid mononucleotide adenyltransferase [Maribacter sp. Hal144]
MKKTVLFLAVLLVTSASIAQTEPELKLNKETNLIEATYFHDNGEISQKGTFNMQKKLHGKWISYNEEGEKISIGNYTNGLKTGKWVFMSGDDKKEVEYSNNAIASVDGIKKKAPVVKN